MGNGWSTNEQERKCITCAGCGVNVGGLTTATHLFEDRAHLKTFIFWHNSASEATFGVSTSFGSESGGAAGISTIVKPGQPLVKMFRKDKEKHVCAECFSVYHPTLFRDVCATYYGKGYIINVKDFTLVDPVVGAM